MPPRSFEDFFYAWVGGCNASIIRLADAERAKHTTRGRFRPRGSRRVKAKVRDIVRMGAYVRRFEERTA